MEKRLEKFVGNIGDGVGDNPLVFLDTGAVIDFERELEFWKLRSHDYNSSRWYSNLGKGLPLFVTEEAMKEITRHHEKFRINNRPEISEETFGIVQGFHENYCKFLKEMSMNPKSLDQVRFDTYWASKLAFKDDYKKGVLDVISPSDREMISTAVWLRYALDKNNRDITSCRVLSPDSHLKTTIEALTDQNRDIYDQFGEFGYNNIRVVSSRGNKK